MFQCFFHFSSLSTFSTSTSQKQKQKTHSLASSLPSPSNDDDDNVFRILISSDNHLGAWEKDEIRKRDSFDAFDEVFRLASERKADVVLLGGDLFHDNRPSRATVVKAMATLSRHCLVRPHRRRGRGTAAAAAGLSGYEFDEGGDDEDEVEDGDGDGDGDGNGASGRNDEGPKVRIVNRVDGLLAG
jgi:hypothetical protein